MSQRELQSRWFSVNGQRMHVRASVEPTPAGSPVIVLVHGLVVSSRYMRPLARTLAKDFPVFAPDLPGFGRSSKPRHVLTLPELADALAAWMDAAALSRASFVANSLGCQVAVELALRHPARVERLVLQSPTMEAGRRTFGKQLARLARNSTREPLSLLGYMTLDYLQAGPRRALATFRMALADRIEDKLPRVQVPVLVVVGERDALVSPAWSERMAALAPQGQHVLLGGAAHTAVLDAPRLMARAVRRFVAGQPLAARLDPDPPAPAGLAGFDSASGLVRAASAFLHGEDFPGLGLDHPLEPLLPATRRLPRTLLRRAYSSLGWTEAVRPGRLRTFRDEEVCRWAAGRYPAGRFPAVLVGSSNGAALHLAAALGAPWLPQTYLVAVRHYRQDVLDPQAALDWGRAPGQVLLSGNPDLELHHMHDPNQDWLMSRHMAYFRVKKLRLGPTYEDFLAQRLAPGGTVVLVECGQSWPQVRVGERHFFQTGAVGGIAAEEYLQPSERLRSFFADRASAARVARYAPPAPDVEAPEAEWGFAPGLRDDVLRVAGRLGARVCRLVFDAPDELAPWVAELYRRWYRELGRPAGRLLVESFILVEPWLALHGACVPYWTTFPVEPSADVLEAYLAQAEPYEQLHLLLFSHGVESAGLAPPARWQAILRLAREQGMPAGVDLKRFPCDFGVYRLYQRELQRQLGTRYPLPPPLSFDLLERHARDAAAAGSPVSWVS